MTSTRATTLLLACWLGPWLALAGCPAELDGRDTLESAGDAETVDSDTVDTDTVHPNTVDSDTVDSDTVDTQQETVDVETSDSEPTDSAPEDATPGDSDTIVVGPADSGPSDSVVPGETTIIPDSAEGAPDTHPADTDATDTIESDAGETVDTVDPVESGQPDPGITDTALSDTDAADDSDLEIDPPLHQAACSFPPGVVVPGEDFRSIRVSRFPIFMGAPADVDASRPGREALMMVSDTRYGDSSVYAHYPDAGSVSIDDVTFGRQLPSADAAGMYSHFSVPSSLDMDNDGVEENLGMMLFDYQWVCSAQRVRTGDQPAHDAEWTFSHSDVNHSVCGCYPGDWNADGSPDIAVNTCGPDAIVTWFVQGPFPEGRSLVDQIAVGSLVRDPTDGLARVVPADLNDDGAMDFLIHQAPPGWFGISARDDVAGFFGPPRMNMVATDADVIFRHPLEGVRAWGAPIENLGDIDGDGDDDIAIAMPGLYLNGYWDGGMVYIYKGPFTSGTVLTDRDADSTIAWPGWLAYTGGFVVPLGDVDGDGLADFAVSADGEFARPPPGVDLTVRWPAPADEAPPADTARPARAARLQCDTAWRCVDATDSGPLIVPDTDPPDTGAPSWPLVSPEGAIMIFGDLPPGRVGPEHAKPIIMGDQPNARIGGSGIVAPGDINGDGLADIAFSAYTQTGTSVRIVYPCADFGVPTP